MKIKIYFLFLFITFGCTQNESESSTKTTKKVEIYPNRKNLGEILKSEKQVIMFKIRNTSDEIVRVDKIAKSCGCTAIKMKSKIIKSKSSNEVSIIFDPKNEEGRVEKKVVFRLSNNQFLTYAFQAVII